MISKNVYVRYSEAFKSQVLTEIESGSLSIAQARSKYSIRGMTTITDWARKSGRFGIVPKLLRVETPNERDETKALKEENKRLKAAIADLVMDRKIAESTLEVLCEQQGWDIEQIKKKAGILLQKKSLGKEKK
jgi:transposase-like protein